MDLQYNTHPLMKCFNFEDTNSMCKQAPLMFVGVEGVVVSCGEASQPPPPLLTKANDPSLRQCCDRKEKNQERSVGIRIGVNTKLQFYMLKPGVRYLLGMQFRNGEDVVVLRKPTKRLSQDNRSPSLDLNPRPPAYKVGVLTNCPRRSIPGFNLTFTDRTIPNPINPRDFNYSWSSTYDRLLF
jgi:hypothetical protein